MALSLKQIITRLEILAQSHKQVNHVFVGDIDELLDEPSTLYPKCLIELQNTGTVDLSNRVTNYTFRVAFFDLLDIAKDSLNNQFEVKSDLASIAQDFIAMVNFTDYQYDMLINPISNLTVATYQLQDLCAGVYVDITIGTFFDANRCQVPATNITFEPNQDNYFIKFIPGSVIYFTATATKVLTVPALIGASIVLILRGGLGVDSVVEATSGVPTGSTIFFNKITGTLTVNDEFIFINTEILTIQFYLL